jgi:hypothetical protein
MQNQEHIYSTARAAQPDERVLNNDPREQSQQQADTYQPYEEGYRGLRVGDIWNEGEKLRPEPKSEKSVGGLLALVALLCAVFIAGSIFGVILSWLSWLVVILLIVAGLSALATNWRIVTIPMPVRTFQITEHARLVIANGAGKIAIRRGEEGMISVAATKRASGFGIDPEKMQIGYDQRGDALNIFTQVSWNILQFGLRSIDFEITVPASCDIQLENGSGRIIVQGTAGDMRLRTGSGGVEAYDLQGQIAIKTGSGGMKLGNLQGNMLVTTGSGGVKGEGLQGQLSLTTGSGGVVLNQSRLAGTSRIFTGSGGISFAGALDPHSVTEMKTGSGGIALSLPANTSFLLNAKTGSGGVRNEFGSNEAGDGPRARLQLKTGSGGISIAKSVGW